MADVNAYLREFASADVSAKDFRTWAGTVLTVLALGAIGPFANQNQAKANIRRAIGAVAVKLGNTVSICRKCYIHPLVLACYLEGKLPVVRVSEDVAATGLPKEEAAVLRILKRGSAARRVAPQRKKVPARNLAAAA